MIKMIKFGYKLIYKYKTTKGKSINKTVVVRLGTRGMVIKTKKYGCGNDKINDRIRQGRDSD